MTASCAWQHPFERVEDVAATFDAHDYVADRPPVPDHQTGL